MNQDIKVFISYAHESEPFRLEIKNLADWLSRQGISMITDHAHEIMPPELGWPAWMLQSIETADVVLAICTPRYRIRFEKKEDLSRGLGVTYEGAILTQDLYDGAMRNRKIYPILPANGEISNIPVTLKPWFNGFKFPSDNEKILKLIHAAAERKQIPVAPGKTEQAAETTPDTLVQKMQHLCLKKLEKAEASSFLKALAERLELSWPAPAQEVFEQLALLSADKVMFRVQSALRKCSIPASEGSERHSIDLAASALYMWAAVRMLEDVIPGYQPGHSTVEISVDDSVIVALVSEALLGGVINFHIAQAGQREEVVNRDHWDVSDIGESGPCRSVDEVGRVLLVNSARHDLQKLERLTSASSMSPADWRSLKYEVNRMQEVDSRIPRILVSKNENGNMHILDDPEARDDIHGKTGLYIIRKGSGHPQQALNDKFIEYDLSDFVKTLIDELDGARNRSNHGDKEKETKMSSFNTTIHNHAQLNLAQGDRASAVQNFTINPDVASLLHEIAAIQALIPTQVRMAESAKTQLVEVCRQMKDEAGKPKPAWERIKKFGEYVKTLEGMAQSGQKIVEVAGKFLDGAGDMIQQIPTF